MSFKFNKKGEKYLSIWWFGILILIGGFIVFGVLIFYTNYLDIRDIESQILANKISECYLNEDLTYDSLEEDFFSNCYLNENLFTGYSNYFILVKFPDKEIKLGNHAFEEYCKISGRIRSKNLPKCSSNDLILNGERVTIMAGSNYFGGKDE